ncbi:MAG: hypothetical protein ABI151_11200 [Chitinophagaceae bacterium]
MRRFAELVNFHDCRKFMKQEINASTWTRGVYTLSISQKSEKGYLLKVLKD